MKFKEFLQRIVGGFRTLRITVARPLAADVPLADVSRIVPIIEGLVRWKIPRFTLIAVDRFDAEDMVGAIEKARQAGLKTSVRGRATDLAQPGLLADLFEAGAEEIEILFLSPMAEVHDALAGAGDYRNALKSIDSARAKDWPCTVLIPLVPSTWKTVDRTLEFLADRHIDRARMMAVVCPSGEPSSWALGPDELLQAARLAEDAAAQCGVRLVWAPPTRFRASRSLAEQVRRGPRTSDETSVRIESDGRVIPARGPIEAAGNLLADDWEKVARSPIMAVDLPRAEGASRCSKCPGLAACAARCVIEPTAWAESDEK